MSSPLSLRLVRTFSSSTIILYLRSRQPMGGRQDLQFLLTLVNEKVLVLYCINTAFYDTSSAH